MKLRPTNTVFRGIAKSRQGRPSIGLQTLIDRAKTSAFFDELHKWAEEVSAEKALEAAKQLSKTKKERAITHLERGLVPAILAPGISSAGVATKAFLDAKKGRLGAAKDALKGITKGEVARTAIQGGLAGSAISLGHEGLALRKAKDTYDDFLRQHGRA